MPWTLAFSSLSNGFCSRSKESYLSRNWFPSKHHYVSFKFLLAKPLPRLVNASRCVSQTKNVFHCSLPRAQGLGEGGSQPNSDSEQPSVGEYEPTGSSTKETILGFKLPRRSLLVQFTCNACGERTQRLVNRVAYERGTIFLQCAGCQQYHKFVDNLGLVVEYDFRTDENSDTEED